jgi:hypothetical protein
MVGIPILVIPILAIPILAIVTPFWLSEERGENFTIVIEYNCMHGWCFNDHDVLNRFKWHDEQREKTCWIARVVVKKSGQVVCRRHCQPITMVAEVPNGYARWARTPLRWWCDQIPILVIPVLVIPILAIHPNRDPNFSNPSRLGSRF